MTAYLQTIDSFRITHCVCFALWNSSNALSRLLQAERAPSTLPAHSDVNVLKINMHNRRTFRPCAAAQRLQYTSVGQPRRDRASDVHEEKISRRDVTSHCLNHSPPFKPSPVAHEQTQPLTTLRPARLASRRPVHQQDLVLVQVRA